MSILAPSCFKPVDDEDASADTIEELAAMVNMTRHANPDDPQMSLSQGNDD